MENNLHYAQQAASSQFYLNIAKDLSALNSKNEEITTRDGHVYGYLCNFTVIGGSAILSTAPNTWKMRNAFRKFHAYRNIMFDNAGVEGSEMGRYGKTIRPYLDVTHTSAGELTPLRWNSVAGSESVVGGQWEYSVLATTPIFGEGPRPGTSIQNWADAFTMHICEDNIIQLAGDDVNSAQYSSVGMIHSYNLDRMEVVTPSADEVLSGPSNPLAQLRLTGNQAGGAVLDIAETQELEAPPYDILDDGSSIETAMQKFVATTSEFATLKFTAFVPAGVARINLGTSASNISVEVIGKILCKDME